MQYCDGFALTIVAFEKQQLTYSECVSIATVMQNVKRMRRIMSPVSCPALPHISASQTTRFSGGKVTWHKMCVLICFTTGVSHIPHSNNNSARYCHQWTKSPHAKYPLLISYFNQTWILSTYSKILISIFMKIPPVRTGPGGRASGHEVNLLKPTGYFTYRQV
jgi:hypothetical protein